MPVFTASQISTTPLAKIIGMESKKENSAASEAFTPKNFITEIVAPLRERPGNTAIPCATPVTMAGRTPHCERRSCGLYSFCDKTISTMVSVNPTGSSFSIRVSGTNNLTSNASAKVGTLASTNNSSLLSDTG